MSGLISLQISITGNLERDQQILLFGIGGLIGLIILAMIIIVVIVIIRRAKRNKLQLAATAMSPATVVDEKKYAPVEPKPSMEQKAEVEKPVEAAKPIPVVEEKRDEKLVLKAEQPIAKVEEKQEPIAPTIVEQKPEPKKEEPKKEDKLEEIRRRLEEIRTQKGSNESSIVLPKIEAAPKEEKIEIEKPVENTEAEIVIPLATEETILVEDTEDVAVPIHIDTEEEEFAEKDASQIITGETTIPSESRMIEDEGVMKEISVSDIAPEEEEIAPQAEPTDSIAKEEFTNTHLPNGKFLPMKKMTFAEWVELFK